MPDFRLFIDESGDPSPSSINPDFPIFVLSGCIFEESAYVKTCAEVDTLKRDLFGSTDVVLHSRDIRKCEGAFTKLFDLDLKQQFYERLNTVLSKNDYTVIAVAIRKDDFISRYGKLADDPYELSLSFLLERALMHTDKKSTAIMSVTIEGRGAREDAILQSRYNELLDRGTKNITPERFKKRFSGISFRRKRDNDCGLQIADLCAYPIARHLINPKEPYPAFDILEKKIRRGPTGSVDGYGLKVFP